MLCDSQRDRHALADPLRSTLLELLLERADTVTEMAWAVDRPKSTIAFHVKMLVDVGLLRVVRTRRGEPSRSASTAGWPGRCISALCTGPRTWRSRPGSTESQRPLPSLQQPIAADELRCLLVHARIPIEDVRNPTDVQEGPATDVSLGGIGHDSRVTLTRQVRENGGYLSVIRRNA